MLLSPINIVFGPAGFPLFLVVGVRHIHAVMYPFVVFPAVKLAALVLGSSIRSRSDLPGIFKLSCRRTGRVASLRVRSIGLASGRFSGGLLVIGTFLFQGCVKSNQNLAMTGALVVPLAGRLVIGVQVYHIGDEVNGVESGGLLRSLASLLLDVCEEIPGCLAQLVEVGC